MNPFGQNFVQQGQKQQGARVNVNTRLCTMYSETAMIAVVGWNKQVSLRIAPAVGKDPETGLTIYEQDSQKQLKTAIVQPNVAALLDGIEKILMPAYNEGKPARITIMIGKAEKGTRKALTLATDGSNIWLEATVNLSSDDINANDADSIRHVFSTQTYKTNYDPKVGGGEAITVQADFLNFVEQLKSVYIFQGAVGHAVEYVRQDQAASSQANAQKGFGRPNPAYQSNMMSGGSSSTSPFPALTD